nr:flagellin [uncultured Oscillibacter sp.]
MRIQHNIMAMSAYRNYTNNVSAMKKNLEKLSSGYKINRAGDDAAGLAISEKMRAQITGLETAQKNAKDGISLVQTAEGALTEVHDMLNRMVELATQSANGTYDNTTDRAQMQKEMDQLRSEINRIADSSNFNGIKLFDGSMEANKVEYKVTNGADLGILATGGTDVTKAGTSTIVHQDGKDATKTKFSVELENVSFTTTANSITVNITVGNGTAISAAVSSGISGEDLASKLGTACSTAVIGGVTYSVTADGSKLVFEMTNDALEASTKAASFTGNFAVVASATGTGNTQVGSVNLGTQLITEGNAKVDSVLANTKLANALGKGDIKDGTALTIGGTTYVFTSTKETADAVKAAGDNFKAVDISDLVDDTGALDDNKAGDGNAVSAALAKLTEAAKDNEMFTVGHDATNGILTFQEKSTYAGDADLTTRDNIQKQIQKGTFEKVTTVAAKGDGKGLMLQIGDTADDFNQLRVSLGDMHCKSLMDENGVSLADIKISDQASAATAVDVIKAAINQVSDVRGTLGATQNRLDHTINNLSVMTENIQDAESTIRDVDVAEEMMAYTKNNILIQSAQAMLAQANQVPQGVLQLLQ